MAIVNTIPSLLQITIFFDQKGFELKDAEAFFTEYVLRNGNELHSVLDLISVSGELLKAAIYIFCSISPKALFLAGSWQQSFHYHQVKSSLG